MSKLTMYKYSPEILKPLFWTYSNVDSSNGKVYYADDLTFYNGIPDTVEFTDKKCFKFIYLYGLHDPRNITADLRRAPDWSISGDEQAVALNKILSYYFDILRKNGVYDNSDIVVLADHGIKTNEDGRYPFLMIKRKSDQSSEFITSDVPVSYSNVYPTLLEIAGGDTDQATVYEIEREEPKRYFASTDEYTFGSIKN